MSKSKFLIDDEVYKQVESFKWNDLEGNCFAMLQEKPTSRASGGSEKIDTDIKGMIIEGFLFQC